MEKLIDTSRLQDEDGDIFVKSFAHSMIAQSRMLLKIYHQQQTIRSTNNDLSIATSQSLEDIRNGQSSMDILMRGGSFIKKSELIRIMKKHMTTEILKVPWLSLLLHEFGKVVERK